MAPVRLEPAAPRSRVKHSITEPLLFLNKENDITSIFWFSYGVVRTQKNSWSDTGNVQNVVFRTLCRPDVFIGRPPDKSA